MKRRTKVAIVRGKFLNKYEMQLFEPLSKEFDLTAFGSLAPIHERFVFPVIKLPSPMDMPGFPYKMPILNRIFVDAHYLLGLEEKLNGFDIAHSAETYYHYTQQVLNAKKKGYVKKVVITVLENIPFNNEEIWRRKAFKKRARDEADILIALTHRAKEALLKEGAEPSKITVIGHGIDTKIFQPSKSKHLTNRLNVLFVGRLEIEKGIYEIIYAIKELLSDRDLKGYKLTFTFVGRGSQYSKLSDLERKLGISDFITHKYVPYEEINLEFQNADMFIAPSKPTRYWEEQFSDALMEAQASGLPIITTTSGSIPENVGDSAVLINPGSAVELANAMKKFILDSKLRKEFGLKARERALKVHDINVVSKKLSKLYKLLLI